MRDDQVYLVTDFETRSTADLKKVGSYEYARHPSTEILCVSWRLGSRKELRRQIKEGVPAKVWSPFLPSPYGEFKNALTDPTVIKVAHNAFFEQVITRFVLPRILNIPRLAELPPAEWLCTASLARAMAMPGKLELACPAAEIPFEKDMAGHRLMLQMSKPRKPKKDENPEGVYWHFTEEKLRRLMKYCAADVDAETALLLKLPPLSEYERKVWILDQTINWRGFGVDRELVKTTLKMIRTETKRLDRQTAKVTEGAVETTRKVAAMREWLAGVGCKIPDLKKKTVEDTLKRKDISPEARALLAIRLAASKTSTNKYKAFNWRSATDGRIRDSLVYWGASTGRFAGAGLQPHNFPRGTIKNAVTAAEYVKEGDIELLRLLYGEPMQVFASCLRPVIIPTKGKKFYCGDFAGIEVRVLFWLAGHEDGLDAFREGRDLYVEQAGDIYNKPVTKEDKDERQLGKKAVLGCGFGMGAKKFKQSCEDDGILITAKLAERSVKAYRERHSAVPQMWRNLERAAIAAVQNPGETFKANKTAWTLEGRFLYCTLPSGRRITYVDPKIKYVSTPWGERKPELSYMGYNSMKKKWLREKTYGGKLTENVVQAVSRCLMVHAMFEVEREGYEVVLTVHDELLTENGDGDVVEFESLMSRGPKWAKGLPIKVDAWEGSRYKK